jgi:hypothetical protein
LRLNRVPEQIPLGPRDIINILRSLDDVDFDQATSSWIGRFIRKNAKTLVFESAKLQLEAMGWEWDGSYRDGKGSLRPGKNANLDG